MARGRFWRWTGGVFSALIVALLLVLYFLDWNQFRGPIGRYLSTAMTAKCGSTAISG